MPSLKEASRTAEERLVKISVTDSTNSETSHEVAIPLRLAKLIGALNDLIEDPAIKDCGFSSAKDESCSMAIN